MIMGLGRGGCDLGFWLDGARVVVRHMELAPFGAGGVMRPGVLHVRVVYVARVHLVTPW